MKKLYDQKCFELATFFLRDEASTAVTAGHVDAKIDSQDNVDNLAMEIQQTIEDFLANLREAK